ncbi:MAG: CinA family protein [Alphaproteobacteria bacterium]|nr:CinA family protein [Alphaproteobacteria bacterium]
MADLAVACIDTALVARAREVMERLVKNRLSVVTAESCTAGLVAAALSQADGASDRLHGCFVAYTKANKSAALGVSEQLLKEKGSVNAEVARAMVEGALARSPADIAVAVTGVLGPDPDEDGNPVGLVWYGYGRKGGPIEAIEKRSPPAPQDQLWREAVCFALECIERAIKMP